MLESADLVAIVDRHVTHAGSCPGRCVVARYGNGVTQLVRSPTQRPLLGEGVLPPVAAGNARKRVDVLNDAAPLVVRLFDQKAVPTYVFARSGRGGEMG